MHLLLLRAQVSPSALLLPFWTWVSSVLLGHGLVLFALKCHLLHLLLHYEVFLLLLEEHQLLVLGKTLQLGSSHFRIHHELLVAMLEGVALQNLLLLG